LQRKKEYKEYKEFKEYKEHGTPEVASYGEKGHALPRCA